MAKKKKTAKGKKNLPKNATSDKERTIAAPPTKKQKTAAAPKAASKDFFEQVLKGKSIYVFLGLLGIIAFAVYGSFWMTEQVFLFKDIGSDTINGLYPVYYWNAETWEAEGTIPSWSFATGLGQNVMLMNMGDPFVWLMYLGGKDNIIHALGYIEAIKVILAGLCFYAYLRTMKMTYFAATIGGLIYAFSGFMMVGSGWFLFTIEGLYFALFLLAFERFLLEGKWGLFPVALMLICMWQPVDVYIFAVCIATYGTIRILDVNDFDWADLGKKYLQLAGLGILGLMMGAIILLPSVDLILNSPRVLGESTFFDTLQSKSVLDLVDTNLWQTAKARLLSTNLLVNDVNGESVFRGAMNFLEAPAIYCSLGTLLLLPQVFAFLSKQQRILYGGLLVVYLLPLVFPFLRYTFWLYSGDYFRFYSLFVVFILLYLAVRAAHFIYIHKRVSWIGLGIGVALALYCLYSIANTADNVLVVNESKRTTIGFLIVINALLIGAWALNGLRPLARLVFIVVLVIDLISVARPTLNDRSVATEGEFTTDKVGYNDYTVDAVNYIKSIDPSFHRIEKYGYHSGIAIHSSINDAKVQGYMGSKSYNSFNQLNYIRFLGGLDVINQTDENQTRWASGVGTRQLLNMLISNKYILTKMGPNKPVGIGYRYLKNFGDVAIFENQHFLPFGFTYDKMILRSEFDQIQKNNISKDITLLKAVVIEDEDKGLVSQLTTFDTSVVQPSQYTETVLSNDVVARSAEHFTMEFFRNAHFKGNITLSKDKMLFFSMPYDKGWTAKVNGQATNLQKINVGLTGIMLPKGEHEIEMIYHTPYASVGRWVSLLGLFIYGSLVWWWMKSGSLVAKQNKNTINQAEKDKDYLEKIE